VIFLSERKDFTEQWRQLGNQISGGPNAWTDAYLAVLAGHNNATVITLDRAFRSIGKAAITPLL
jgi:predicted nucleic acid-binding protein